MFKSVKINTAFIYLYNYFFCVPDKTAYLHTRGEQEASWERRRSLSAGRTAHEPFLNVLNVYIIIIYKVLNRIVTHPAASLCSSRSRPHRSTGPEGEGVSHLLGGLKVLLTLVDGIVPRGWRRAGEGRRDRKSRPRFLFTVRGSFDSESVLDVGVFLTTGVKGDETRACWGVT